jgi:tetratricopeptide (TPR) repeat protein
MEDRAASGGPRPLDAAAQNREALRQIAASGADLSRPRQVNFYFYVSDRPTAERGAVSLQGDGYRTLVRKSQNSQWLLLASITAVLSEEWLNARATQMNQLAQSLGGEFDGWEAAVDGPPHAEGAKGAATLDQGEAARKAGDLEQAVLLYEQAAGQLSAAGDAQSASLALSNTGLGLAELGRTEEAVTALQRALAISRDAGDPDGLARNLLNLGALLITQGRVEEAEQLYQLSSQLSAALGRDHRMLSAWYNLAWVTFLKGDYGRADGILDHILASDLSEMPATSFGLAMLLKARLAMRQREFDRCDQFLSRAADAFQKAQNGDGLAMVEFTRRCADFLQHDAPPDRRLLLSPIERLRDRQYAEVGLLRLVALGALSQGRGFTDQGRQLVEAAHAIAVKKGCEQARALAGAARDHHRSDALDQLVSELAA